jgi:PAS domain S-box-containing protein
MTLTDHRFTAEQLDALTDLIPVGIIRLDPHGNCLHANARWCVLTGLSVEAARGEGWRQSIAPGDRERVVRAMGGADAGEYAEEFHLRRGRWRATSPPSRI